MKIAALDIGGTSIKSGIWEDGVLTGLEEQDTNARQGGAYVMERAVGLLDQLVEHCGPVDAIGISTAGQVDTRSGSIYYANENIPGYTGMKVKAVLEEHFHVPVAVENDVNAAALGEGWKGAAADSKDYLCLTYGTGVGGAIVIDRTLYTGSSWSAGSFGGIVIHPEAVRAGEEFSGCYEKYASTTGLVRKAMELNPALDSGRKIFAALEQERACGGEVCRVQQVVDQWIDEILYGLITLVHIFNPSKVVLGGGIMAQDYVLSRIQQKLPAMVAGGFDQLEIVRAALGNQAGLYGAVWLAKQYAEQENPHMKQENS